MDEIPLDVWWEILKFLPLSTILATCCVSKSFSTKFSTNQVFWEEIFRLRSSFKKFLPKSPRKTWKKHCLKSWFVSSHNSNMLKPNKDGNFLMKVIMLGDTGVGKTSIVLRFRPSRFGSPRATIGADFETVFLRPHIIPDLKRDEELILKIWDTAGQERFQSLGNSYYKDSVCAVLVCDITNRDSFSNISKWHGALRDQTYFEETEDTTKMTQIILLGNKVDLSKQRKVSREELEELGKEIQAQGVFETSAKCNINISEAFHTMARKTFKLFKFDEDAFFRYMRETEKVGSQVKKGDQESSCVFL